MCSHYVSKKHSNQVKKPERKIAKLVNKKPLNSVEKTEEENQKIF